jgi:hypothetical protein
VNNVGDINEIIYLQFLNVFCIHYNDLIVILKKKEILCCMVYKKKIGILLFVYNLED